LNTVKPDTPFEASGTASRIKISGTDATTRRFTGYGRDHHTERTVMSEHTYRVIELVGSSEISHADAIENAIIRASQTMRHLRWFEVVQQRGEVHDGKIQHFQVTMKVGLTLED
jgi:flavin-binding protein dodecin